MATVAKKETVESLKAMLPETKATLVTDHTGLNVDEINGLRNQLRKEGIEFHVVKNTLARIAATETGHESLNTYLEGPTAIAFVKDDPVAAAKLLVKFIKEHKKLVLKGGLLEGKIITAEGIRAVADLPPREVLLARLAGTMMMPLNNMAGVLSGPIRSFAYALHAVQQQKAEG
ncbi:MAG: 50S ribosomal protein L10 [bacterium]|nr:50S ribosomal protein L10 [bacterium]